LTLLTKIAFRLRAITQISAKKKKWNAGNEKAFSWL